MISLKTTQWQINNIETVLFDKDGTFIDLHYFWGKITELRAKEVTRRFKLEESTIRELCLKLGYDTNNCKMLSNGITAMYSRQKIIAIFKNDLRDFDVYTTENELEEIFDKVSNDFYTNMQAYTKPIDSAIRFIKELKKHNIKIGIVTSDSIESTQKTIKQFNWEHLFDTAVGREASTFTKESGELTKLALNKLNANPKTTIMIGDAPMDYISAKNANVEKTILVSTGQIEEKELQKISEYTVSNLSEIEITIQ